ncbi:Dolichyl-P-Man:Man(5)GlcNAc(2)-PP-dolichyl mannosyltransferase [Terfezia claveryi]|nr:Dolichyl-P-Man:Man(5)GlcNAc(2)-PP-dolichyl mannosyltransferase [Terfezia claveryi]
MGLVRSTTAAVSDPKYSKYLAPLLLIADACLSSFILFKIPYTEIDWKAYMEQVALYLNGESDYVKLKGGTGPLVYPAGHVYVYSWLYKITDQGRDIWKAQCVFVGFYLLMLALVLMVYIKAKAPPYILPLLILSKRLHSIYILRLFNDTFNQLFFFLSLLTYQSRLWTLGSLLYSLSVSIKMNTLLALPGIGIVLLHALGRDRAVGQASIMLQAQVILAWPFISTNAKSYLTRAFEFSRVFLWKWTVNWRFLGREWFLSKELSYGLLAAHAAILGFFVVTRWIRPARLPLRAFLITYLLSWDLPQQGSPRSLHAYQLSQRVTPRFIATTILTSNLIGVLCARSLHYQFYSWVAWGTPYLLYKANFHPIVIYALWAGQEWAWNVYPSTKASSIVVESVLAVTVVGVWWGTRKGDDERAEGEGRRLGRRLKKEQ